MLLSSRSTRTWVALVVFLAAGIALFGKVDAAASVSPATGGSAISADTTGGTFTSLVGPTVTEGATADIGVGTIILNAPTGFIFSTTTNSVTATRSDAGGSCSAARRLLINGGASQTATPALTTITITITRSSSVTCRNVITWSGIKVRPSAGAPLATGNIVKTGTSSINNVTSTTNFGTLTEVPGAKNKTAFTVQPSATATANADFPTKPTVAVEDQFGNIVTVDNLSTITLTPKLSTQTCAGTSGSGTLTSTPSASASTVSSGVIAYTAMSYSYGESIKICATSPGITPALSNAITVNNPVPTTSSISPTSTLVGGPTFSLTVIGTGFFPYSIVNINGSARSTTFVSATQLTATVLASDIASAGTSTITVFNPAPGGGTSNIQYLRILSPATQFVIVPPGNGTVDAPVAVTVEAETASGTLDTTFNGGVTLNTTGSATGGGLVTITNGVGTSSVADTIAETVDLSLTDSEGTGLNVSSTQTLTFAPGAVAQFYLTSSGEAAAGTRLELSVARKDQYGNEVTSGLTTVYLYSTATDDSKKFYDAPIGGSVITKVDILSGSSVANFWYYDEKAAAVSITASDNSSAPDGGVGIADSSVPVQIVPGPLFRFVLNNPGDMQTGTRLGYTVSREDVFGNPVTSGISLVYLYSSSVGTSTRFYDSVSGGSPETFAVINNGASSASFWYYDETVGTWEITASDNPVAPDGVLGVADAVRSVTVSPTPIVATRIVILPPVFSQSGTQATLAIRAEDDSGNLDTTFNGGVTLNTTGSATGGGLVTITNGVGTAKVNDSYPETVIVSLSDTEGTGLDVSSEQNLVFNPTIVAGPISGPPQIKVISGINFSGLAYPGAKINILALGTSTIILRSGTADRDTGSFQVNFVSGLPAGDRAFGVTAIDPQGRSTQAVVYWIKVKNQANVLDIKNILLPPTVGFSQSTVTKGGKLIITGYAVPNSVLQLEVDGKPISQQTIADSSGFYRLLYPTGSLGIDSHTLCVRESGTFGSAFSLQKVFYVTSLLVPQVDFNNDGVVDIRDWSIFLSRWLSPDPKVRALDDLNGDGKVDVQDFSIFVRTLKPA